MQRPPAYHGVVEHDGSRYPGDERPHPRALRAHDLDERPDRPEARESPHPELDENEWDGPDEQKDGPRDEKLAAAVLRGDPWKSPDVARADRHSEHGQHHGDA